MNKEIWKPIPDSHYSISTTGIVRRSAHGPGTYVGRVIKQFLNGSGYPFVNIRIRSKKTSATVHRLASECFLGKRPTGHQVNHKNGIKTDNRVENLEWVTPKENIHHSMLLPNYPRGPIHGMSKLDYGDVVKIKELSRCGFTQRIISKKFGISQSNVSQIIKGITWVTLSDHKKSY